MTRAIAAWPSHLPLIIAFFGLMALLLAFRLRRTTYVTSAIAWPPTRRPLTGPELTRARLQGWMAVGVALSMFAFAGYAYYLHQDSGFEHLMDAVDRDDVGAVRSLLAAKDHAIVNWRRGEGGGKRDSRPVTFPLLVAAQRNQPAIVRLLLEAGADPLPVDRQRRTPLHYAVRPDTTIMALLLDGGSSANGGDLHGKSPLHLAVSTGAAAPVELLLSRGANVNAADDENASPLHEATTAEVAALLCAYDAEPNWPDDKGATPAARALARGDAALAAFLAPEGGPCVWLRTRPGVASAADRRTAGDEAAFRLACADGQADACAPAERLGRR